MSLLFRYLFFRHARLLLLTLALGGGMFMLTDMVDRLDVLLDAGASPMLMLLYYAARCPASLPRFCLQYSCWLPSFCSASWRITGRARPFRPEEFLPAR